LGIAKIRAVAGRFWATA